MEQNNSSNSESLCRPDAFHQVWAQSNLRFGKRCRLKNFKMAAMPSWISERNDFSNSESLCRTDASHHVSAQSDLQFEGRCHLKHFKMATSHLGHQPSWISEWNDFSNYESLCHCDASHEVSAQPDLQFGRCCLKNFKMVAMEVVLDSGMERF